MQKLYLIKNIIKFRSATEV